MTFSTEVKIIAHIADIDTHQLTSLAEFFNTKGLEYKYKYDRLSGDRDMYTVDANITGYGNEFYELMVQMMS